MSYIGNINTHRGLIGKIGEDFACNFLESKGHFLLGRNHRIRFGEIDIISMKENVLHFVEVKTTQSIKTRPEEHLDYRKMTKMKKLAELYFNNVIAKTMTGSESVGISLDFIGVVLDSSRRIKEIRYLEMLEV